MKKVFLLLMVGMVSSATGLDANAEGAPSYSMTKEEALEMYSEIFSFERIAREVDTGTTYRLAKDLSEVTADHVLGALLRKNASMVHYLLGQTGISETEKQEALQDPSFPEAYVEALRRDDTFTDIWLGVVHRHLVAQGGGLANYSPAPKQRISEDEVIKIAVRFVYPDLMNEDGSIAAHVCSGLNGLYDYPHRNPQIEALAYSALSRRYDGESSEMGNVIPRALRLANQLDLSTDKDVALRRAQGLVWGALFSAPEFRRTIQVEYERIGHLLGLDIAGK